MAPVKLIENSREREKYDNMADLFALVRATELLEKAYIQDSVTADEYTVECKALIARFKTVKKLLEPIDVVAFLQLHGLDCPAARNRLLESGVPATVEHGGTATTGNDTRYVAEAVQYFITAMDSLKLNMVAVDELHPLIQDIVTALNKVPTLSPDSEPITKVKTWLVTLNKLQASDELDENQMRQLLFDLETAYNSFHRHLSERP
eukprot:TRINITY_DN11777_c0_g1_i1.p1 TRINITY_DN11777_c0_g1~~TRINITY_DN11777_c0_g1_i1.p1  ORF type:complete len:206 (+),score=29.52 TRINITY_DN11777_c0_g1_i1:68-685(+)